MPCSIFGKLQRLYRTRANMLLLVRNLGTSRFLIRDATQPTVRASRPLELVEGPVRAIQGRRNVVDRETCLGLEAEAL